MRYYPIFYRIIIIFTKEIKKKQHFSLINFFGYNHFYFNYFSFLLNKNSFQIVLIF